MKKKIVILSPHGHRLANQLWNFMSIYAYCLEKGYACQNPSFFRYQYYFNISNRTIIDRVLSFINGFPLKKVRGWSYVLFEKYVALIKNKFPQQVISDKREPHVFYLPPSATKDTEYKERLSLIDTSAPETFYLDGWIFRNPVGVEKYRREIHDYFLPNKYILNKIDNLFTPLRKKYATIVGVHVRQGDYKEFEAGKYYFTNNEVRAALESYLQFHGFDREQTLFMVCSDGPVSAEDFPGLHTVFPAGDAALDLFALAKTDVIIGPDSTFGAFASYYGNVPFVVLERGGIDWEHYRGKSTYFENKKNTLTFY